jgi:imidazolonepropionase-like amidohydrolase
MAGCARSHPDFGTQRVELAIRAGRVLHPESGTFAPSQLILVNKGVIVDVVPDGRRARIAADTIIDASALTILPGLIDAHVHLGIGGPPGTNALAALRAGFTTVVDLGARTHRILRLRDSINAGQVVGPRVLAAGLWIGVRGGVCEFGGIGVAGGPDAFRARVEENVAAGADVIKLCVSGWPAEAFTEPGKYEMSDEVLRAAIDAAHARGRLTIAHDISAGGVAAGIRASLDGLAHAAFLDTSAAAALRRANVFLIPTLTTLAGDDSPASAALVLGVRHAHRAGVLLVFGTDGGVLPHGRNAEEFGALLKAGLTPMEAIRTATSNAAAALRLRDSLGVIKRGASADFVGVSGDPTTDISVLRSPRLVISRGRMVVP